MTRRPIRILITSCALLGAALIAMSALIASNLRDDAIRVAEVNLNRHSLTLAGQAERSFQSIELILSSISDHVVSQGVFDSASYGVAMAGEDTFKFLQGKLAGLPQLEALTMIDAEGKLINFSRYWPIPDVNVADRDYFKALSNDDTRSSFIGQPVQNRGTGTWNIYIARRVNGAQGKFTGLILAAISLQYFEEFYRSISLGEGSAQSLLRDDGTVLARYPATPDIGKVLNSDLHWALKSSAVNTARQVSPVDRKMRIKAAKKLLNAPLIIMTTQTESSILEPWLKAVRLLVLFTGGMILLSVLSAALLARHWKQQGLLIKAKAEQAETERAMARVETELLREKESTAEAANRAKSSFLAMMSHEIRTPMNAVIGLTSALLESRLSNDQRSSVEAIHLAGDNLLEIINDILDFSRLEAGGLTIEEVPFEAAPVIASALAIIGASAAAKGLSIEVDIANGLPATLLGDPGRIRQILLNLLSNAVKFTSSGSITVKVECIKHEGEFALMRWSVSDTGMGIPADRIGALFNDFVQVDNTVSRRFGGSGLGLSICRRIAEQMGGSIGVSSELGRGTTFELEVKLPSSSELLLDCDNDETSLVLLKAIICRMGRAVRILVVDDSAMNRLVARQMLTGFNVSITEASDGLAAIHAVAGTAFDVIFMDMRMPEMDGLTATAAIRAEGGGCHAVPIIAFTANAFADDREACLRAGMTDFVAKPVRKQRLVRALRRALAFDNFDETVIPTLAMAPPIAASERPASGGRFDQGKFELLCTEISPNSAAEIYHIFACATRAKLDMFVDNGVAMARAEVENDAHMLKSSAGTFGFNELADIAAELERDACNIKEPELREFGHRLQAAFSSEKAEFEQHFRSCQLQDLSLV